MRTISAIICILVSSFRAFWKVCTKQICGGNDRIVCMFEVSRQFLNPRLTQLTIITSLETSQPSLTEVFIIKPTSKHPPLLKDGVHPVRGSESPLISSDLLRAPIPIDHLNRLGRSGLKISNVILGCMQYGTSAQMEWTNPEEKALPIIKHAFDKGINTWDTVRSLHSMKMP